MTSESRTLLAATGRALGAAEAVMATARGRVAAELAPEGALDPVRFEARQYAGHALAWAAATVEALHRLRDWAVRLDDGGAFGEAETLILATAFGEYLGQLAGGIPMAQGEFARPADLGLTEGETAVLRGGEAGALAAGLAAARLRLGVLIAERGEAGFGQPGVTTRAVRSCTTL